MFKYLLQIVVIVTVVGLFSGGFHLYRVAQRNKKEMAPYQGAPIALKGDFGKVLVVYYSLTGNTKDIAERIQKKTQADVYEIKTRHVAYIYKVCAYRFVALFA